MGVFLPLFTGRSVELRSVSGEGLSALVFHEVQIAPG